MKMSRILAVILAFVMMMIMGACAAPQKTEDPAATAYQQRVEHLQLVNDMYLSTVTVFIRGPFGGLASGIILQQEKNETLLLTAGHTARHMLMPGNMSFGASHVSRKGYIAAPAAISKHYDLALVSVAGRLEGIPVRLAKRLPDLGTTVYSMGHTYGYFHTLTKGIVSHVDRHVHGRRLLQVSAQGGPGNSGGPLFNTRGELVGVVVSGPNIGGTVINHMVLCEPLQHIRNFLAKYDL